MSRTEHTPPPFPELFFLPPTFKFSRSGREGGRENKNGKKGRVCGGGMPKDPLLLLLLL